MKAYKRTFTWAMMLAARNAGCAARSIGNLLPSLLSTFVGSFFVRVSGRFGLCANTSVVAKQKTGKALASTFHTIFTQSLADSCQRKGAITIRVL